MHLSLERLMELYQTADPEATTKLVAALAPVLYGFLTSQVDDHPAAEDMLQQVFFKVHQLRHTYQAGQPLLPWVFAIARHVRLDNDRKRSRTSEREMAQKAHRAYKRLRLLLAE